MYFNDGIIKKTNPKINIKEALSERTADLRLRHLERQYSFGNLVQDWLDEKRRVSVFFFFVKDDEVWCKGFTWFINRWSSSFLNMHLTNKHIQKKNADFQEVPHWTEIWEIFHCIQFSIQGYTVTNAQSNLDNSNLQGKL